MLKMDSISRYLSNSIDQVYGIIGNREMKFYYVPVLERKYLESKDFIDYDFENKIRINATLNSDLASDIDLERAKDYLTVTQESATIQFALTSVANYVFPLKIRDLHEKIKDLAIPLNKPILKPHIPNKLDRIYIEYPNGKTANYLIVGIDDGVLLQGIYVSVRVFKMDGVITNFQWANNGVMPNGYELQL